jgi:hypothetical protein
MRIRLFVLAIFVVCVISSCSQQDVPQFEGGLTPTVAKTCRAKLGTAIKDNTKISLATTHVDPRGSGDRANARQNIIDTANGNRAARSSYGNAPGGRVYLDERILNTLNTIGTSLVKGMGISEIAGGSHAKTSKHYDGLAFDINVINGTKVVSLPVDSPVLKRVRNQCLRGGATVVLGPGDDLAHRNHVHCQWPPLSPGQDPTVGIEICQPFEIVSVSSPTGPHNTPLLVDIFYKGHPKFPVRAEIVITQCPSGLTCSGGTIIYETEQQPLSFDSRCNLSNPHPAITTGFDTTLIDANGVKTNTVAATFTCQPSSSIASTSNSAPSSAALEVTLGP